MTHANYTNMHETKSCNKQSCTSKYEPWGLNLTWFINIQPHKIKQSYKQDLITTITQLYDLTYNRGSKQSMHN